ncbi:MAG: FAD-dependent oxidoreductase [Rhodospirillaceae bacterium]|nr:FAD-dependent oxidoreductase [Rhodospirillaceae bacterium]
MPAEQTTSGTVAVIGAGVIGIATALNLLRQGRDVVLVDRLEPGEGASFGNAGVLASSSIIPVTVPGLMFKVPKMLADPLGPVYLRWSYLPRMMPWLFKYLRHCTEDSVRHIARHMAPMTADSLDEHQRLAQGTAAAERITTIPYSFVYKERANFESDPLAWGLREEHGIPWDITEGDAVHEQEPALAPQYKCLVNLRHQHGTIDHPGDYIKDLAKAFTAGGGRIETAAVTGFERADGRITGVITDTGTINAETVVVAAGAWSARLLKSLGINVPMETERGYHVELAKPSIKPNGALMVADGKFVATPMGDELRLAGLVEFGGLDAGPSKAPINTLLKRAEIVFPGIAYESHTEWQGHRPAVSDSLPVMGPVDGHPGLVLAFGHHHVGLTCGPRTGRLIADMVMGKQLNQDMTPYNVARFQ